MRSVAGRGVDDVLTTGRAEVAVAMETLIQEAADRQGLGVSVRAVRLGRVAPPVPVAEAFADAARARSDRRQMVSEAESYRDRTLADARGRAREVTDTAAGKHERLVQVARGQAERFADRLAAARLAPDATRRRLYLEAMAAMLPRFRPQGRRRGRRLRRPRPLRRRGPRRVSTVNEPMNPAPAAVLRDVFGFPTFREGQEAVIGRLLDGRSSLAIFPTGGGKSLCYQVPALLLDGLTVVVSPLIALMKDQVDALKRRGVAAARLDSSLEGEEARSVYRDLRSGRLRLLYVAPERLANERFVQLLAGRPIALLAIDEAHCISEWGHNFRPEYLKLATLARALAVGRVLALTATATPSVAADVARAFEIEDEDVVRTGFHRPNLDLYATVCRPDERRSILLDRLNSRPPEPAIVYVTLQRTAEELAAFLREHGVDAVAYHAGLKAEERDAIQNAFMTSDAQVIVATIAFGMGIDKADIRAIYHYNLPKGPENYAQEVGRAGRDGQPARCELLASPEDVTTLENFAYGDTPTPEAIGSLLDDVLGRGDVFDVSTYELSVEHDIRPLVVRTLLTYLELEGVIEATGPFYGTYKLRFLRPVDAIAGRFDRGRADFLLRLFATGEGRPDLAHDRPGRRGRGAGRAPRADHQGVELSGRTGRPRRPGRRRPDRLPEDVVNRRRRSTRCLADRAVPLQRGARDRPDRPDARLRDGAGLPLALAPPLLRRGPAGRLRPLRPLPGRAAPAACPSGPRGRSRSGTRT